MFGSREDLKKPLLAPIFFFLFDKNQIGAAESASGILCEMN